MKEASLDFIPTIFTPFNLSMLPLPAPQHC